MEYITYVAATGFQLAGALLLIVRYWFHTVDKQLKALEKKRTNIEGETLCLGESQPSNRDLVQEIWLNRMAFLYLAIGYIVGIWGDIGGKSQLIILLFVFITTCILVLVGYFISIKVSDKYEGGRVDED